MYESSFDGPARTGCIDQPEVARYVDYMMRVLICEDHPMCREGMVMAIRKTAPDAEIDKVSSLAEANRYLDAGLKYDFVLTDLMLSDSDGLGSLFHFRHRLPQARVAVATGLTDAGLVVRARAAGAVGFIPKAVPMSDMLDSIQKLVGGEELFPTADFPEQDDPAVRLLELTPSQMKVLLSAARGDLNKEIAYEHGLSEATVKAHLTAAFKKLGVNNRVQAGLIVQSVANSERQHR